MTEQHQNNPETLLSALKDHVTKWGKGIVPVDSEDLKRLLALAEGKAKDTIDGWTGKKPGEGDHHETKDH